MNMKKLKALGLVGIVLVIALMSVSSVWAGPLNQTVAPPTPRKMPAGAMVGTDIDEDDLPDGFIGGKVVETDGEEVTICILVPTEYVPYLHELAIKVQVGGRWVTVPSWGTDNIQGEFYRCATVSLGGTYYLSKP
jgi:hypothetical protein